MANKTKTKQKKERQLGISLKLDVSIKRRKLPHSAEVTRLLKEMKPGILIQQ